MRQPPELPPLRLFDRTEFITRRFDYRAGEHVAFIAPTQSGKTTLGFQLLDQVASPQMQAVVLVEKPRDRTVDKFRKQIPLRLTRSWPPTVSRWVGGRPRGYVLWPRTTFDPNRDYSAKYTQFRRAILESYKTKRSRIVFADEFYKLSELYGLSRECIEILASGSSMGCGGWFATQKPSHVPTWLYGNADHLFLAYDPDERNRKRFGEIGGVNPQTVSDAVYNLGQYQWLYIRRRGRVMCIIDA